MRFSRIMCPSSVVVGRHACICALCCVPGIHITHVMKCISAAQVAFVQMEAHEQALSAVAALHDRRVPGQVRACAGWPVPVGFFIAGMRPQGAPRLAGGEGLVVGGL